MFHIWNRRRLIAIQTLFLSLLLIVQAKADFGYAYSSNIAVGDTMSWELVYFYKDMPGYPDGFYVTDGYYIPEDTIISIEVVEHPNDVYYNLPSLLWNTTTNWYNLYIDDTLETLYISEDSLMTLGFLKLPYLSPVMHQGNNAFQEIYNQESEFNHTSTGTLDETSEFPINYIRSELYESSINSSMFYAHSTFIYDRTQVISENLTYRWLWKEKYGIAFDQNTGILLRQDQTTLNASQIIEKHEISTSITTSYDWFNSILESNYTVIPTTDSSGFLVSVEIISIYLLLGLREIYIRSKRKKL
ncbi:MAG: hypothetical protein GPJ51_03480 [Candidatus Heimdallarchaeota archaeon]|nr:hypothetical protein [Candidatus Heimdallarchaeota archaeon]